MAFTLHQVIKFTTPEGRRPFYGDQVAAKQCYLATISMKTDIKEVQLIEEEREVLEGIRRDPKAKVVEDLIRYELDEPSSDYFFLTSATWRNKKESSSSSS